MITGIVETCDAAQIRRCIADRNRAICAKDLDQIMSSYAPDVIFFDVKPPFQTQGVDAVRQIWERCLLYLPDSFQIEVRDFEITVIGDLAIAHGFFRLTDMATDDAPIHSAIQAWKCGTVGYQRYQGEWKITHEHASIPFHPEPNWAPMQVPK